MNAADDRSQRIAAIEDTLNLTYPDKKYWDNDIAWLLDELEKADKKIAYDEAVLVRSAKEIEKLAKDRDALRANLLYILESLEDDDRDLIYFVRSLIDTPASEGKTP